MLEAGDSDFKNGIDMKMQIINFLFKITCNI